MLDVRRPLLLLVLLVRSAASVRMFFSDTRFERAHYSPAPVMLPRTHVIAAPGASLAQPLRVPHGPAGPSAATEVAAPGCPHPARYCPYAVLAAMIGLGFADYFLDCYPMAAQYPYPATDNNPRICPTGCVLPTFAPDGVGSFACVLPEQDVYADRRPWGLFAFFAHSNPDSALGRQLCEEQQRRLEDGPPRCTGTSSSRVVRGSASLSEGEEVSAPFPDATTPLPEAARQKCNEKLSAASAVVAHFLREAERTIPYGAQPGPNQTDSPDKGSQRLREEVFRRQAALAKSYTLNRGAQKRLRWHLVASGKLEYDSEEWYRMSTPFYQRVHDAMAGNNEASAVRIGVYIRALRNLLLQRDAVYDESVLLQHDVGGTAQGDRVTSVQSDPGSSSGPQQSHSQQKPHWLDVLFASSPSDCDTTASFQGKSYYALYRGIYLDTARSGLRDLFEWGSDVHRIQDALGPFFVQDSYAKVQLPTFLRTGTLWATSFCDDVARDAFAYTDHLGAHLGGISVVYRILIPQSYEFKQQYPNSGGGARPNVGGDASAGEEEEVADSFFRPASLQHFSNLPEAEVLWPDGCWFRVLQVYHEHWRSYRVDLLLEKLPRESDFFEK